MTPVHHISDDLLLRYTSGLLRPASALVVASHIELCAACSEVQRHFECIGGLLLEEQPEARLAPDLFERTLARLDATAPLAERPLRPETDRPIYLPEALRAREIGPWRWMGPGMRFARVAVPEDAGASVLLLGIKPGRFLPVHGHTGNELTLVLQGAFRDRAGRYGVGDLAEEDDQSEHQPLVEDGEECICLAAIEGRMRPNSLLARLIMPAFGL